MIFRIKKATLISGVPDNENNLNDAQGLFQIPPMFHIPMPAQKVNPMRQHPYRNEQLAKWIQALF
jgi:hypothetical protein